MIVFSVGTDVINLLYLMILPVIDGAYVTIILTNQLQTITSSIIIGLSVLSGIASFSVAQRIKGNYKIKIIKITKISIIFLTTLLTATVLAKSLSKGIDTEKLRIFGAISITLIAIRISKENLSPKLAKITNPSIFVIIGIMFSINPSKLHFDLILNRNLIIHSLIAGVSAISLTSIGAFIELKRKSNLLDYIASGVLILISLKILFSI